MKDLPTPTPTRPRESFTAKLLAAQDEERRRISRELHDSVGQSLVAVKMALGRLSKSLDPTQLLEVEAITRMLDDVVTEVRTISHLLHPPTLDLMGLRSSIVWYAEGFQQRTGIHTAVQIPEPLPLLEGNAKAALFRIVQESLTNVHRHAKASNVAIRIDVSPEQLQLEISDDGKGFQDLNRCRVGVGILGMQERVSELSGSLRVESGEGIGSSIIATIPLNNETAVPVELVMPGERPVIPGRRILLVDDHEVTRRGIRALIETEGDLEVCGEAATVKEALEQIQNLHPDVVILDLQLPDESGWSVVRRLRQSGASSKVIIFSHYDADYILRAAQYARCDGCASKSGKPEDLIRAIRSVLEGKSFFGEKAYTVSS
jgi:CheY-like chemotaxis protein